MFHTIDRYILREVIPPFLLALLLLTFLLMIPPIMGVAEELISKGVDGLIVFELLVTLIPQGLGLTIPVSLLLGILMGLGRMSSDREAVALQACGMSLYRMLVPLFVFGLICAGSTFYIMAAALPDANQAFREITFRTVASRAEGEVKPRVFDEYFPSVVLYVREVSSAGDGWRDVFLADGRQSAGHPDIYVAERGRVLLDRDNRTVDLLLENGTGHQVDPEKPDTYEAHEFNEIVIGLDPETVFPRSGPQRGLRELSIVQLQQEADSLMAAGLSAHAPIMEIQRKYSIPLACLVFVVIGLGLGVTSRKDGKLANFALGACVVFAYYVIMYGAEAMAKGGLVGAGIAMWIPNAVLGVLALLLLFWRSTSVERRLSVPFFNRRPELVAGDGGGKQKAKELSLGFSISALRFTNVKILDWYVTRVYLSVIALSFVGLIGVFYISTFIDLSDKLFKGETTEWILLEYFWYATPQFSYYVLPIAVLVATLVTVGLLTKSSELTIMKACGISLYRAALPMFLISIVWSGFLFGMSESVLAVANRHAEALNHEIRTGVSESVDTLDRRWFIGETGSIYHILSFDPGTDELRNLSVYDFSTRPWRLERRTFAEQANYEINNGRWIGRNVWSRDFTADVASDQGIVSAEVEPLLLSDSPEYFDTDPLDAELMNVRELGRYADELRASGFDVVKLVVDFHRKVSFPFVTLILTLIAVPFAVTMGPRGALYGIGVGISLACTYWIVMSVFGAIGSAGMLSPILAAWAPNLLFGASAAYLLLTVKT